MEMRRPRPIYYFFIATATDCVLAAGAILALLIAGLLSELPLTTIGFVLGYNAIIATLVLLVLATNPDQSKTALVKSGGLVLGHLVGLVLGGVLGLEYGGLAWALIGAVMLYFIGGQIGARISYKIGSEVDRLTATPSKRSAYDNTLKLARRRPSFLRMYGPVVPALLMAAGILLNGSALGFGHYSTGLHVARIVTVTLSLLSMLVPWLWSIGSTMQRGGLLARPASISVIGLGLSVAPALYGFLLFLAFGISIPEFGAFAIAATLASIAWVQRK